VSFGDAVVPHLHDGACPHMAVVLRSPRELPAILVPFYELAVSRGGWAVHQALPGALERDRQRLAGRGLDVARLEGDGRMELSEFDPAESPADAAERYAGRLEEALARGLQALWYSRFPIGPGAEEFESATAYDRAWDARLRGHPVVTLCPYVLAGDAEARIDHLARFHDAIFDADGRVRRSATQSKPT
jgi:MEDS: MEthanogen/methylotroph, DcmR Sensory domain